MNHHDQAAADFNKALELDPGIAETYYDGQSYNRRVISLNPPNASTFYFSGLQYFDMEEYDQAIENFDIAIDYDSEYVDAYYNRGLAYYLRRDTSKRLIITKRLLLLNRKNYVGLLQSRFVRL